MKESGGIIKGSIGAEAFFNMRASQRALTHPLRLTCTLMLRCNN